MKDLKKGILDFLKTNDESTLLEIAREMIEVDDRKDWEKLIKTLDVLESGKKIAERRYPDGKIAYSLG